MKVNYEDFIVQDEDFNTVEVDVADVMALAMEQDPSQLMSLFIELARREFLTLHTALTFSQKSDLQDIVEVICRD